MKTKLTKFKPVRPIPITPKQREVLEAMERTGVQLEYHDDVKLWYLSDGEGFLLVDGRTALSLIRRRLVEFYYTKIVARFTPAGKEALNELSNE